MVKVPFAEGFPRNTFVEQSGSLEILPIRIRESPLAVIYVAIHIVKGVAGFATYCTTQRGIDLGYLQERARLASAEWFPVRPKRARHVVERFAEEWHKCMVMTFEGAGSIMTDRVTYLSNG
jgi:hypothetical protein